MDNKERIMGQVKIRTGNTGRWMWITNLQDNLLCYVKDGLDYHRIPEELQSDATDAYDWARNQNARQEAREDCGESMEQWVAGLNSDYLDSVKFT